MWNKLFFLMVIVGISIDLPAQIMPDTVGLPRAVTKYIADLSGVVTAVNIEKTAATTALEKLQREHEVLKTASIGAAKEAMEDVERLEDAVDLRKKRIVELESVQTKGETNVKEIEQKNKTLSSELENLRVNHKKLEEKLAKQKEEAKQVKGYKTEAAKVQELEAQKTKLERKLSTVLQDAAKYKKEKEQLDLQLSRISSERNTLEQKLSSSKQALTQLKKDCEAYAQKVKEDLLKLQKDAVAILQASRFSISVDERQALIKEAKRLQEVVTDKEVQRHQQVYARINKILALGEVMDAARAQLNKDYDNSKVKASANNLKNADVTGFSSGVEQERVELLKLLNGYCKEYARIKDFFDQINEAGDAEITESFLPRYLEGQYRVDEAYGFLREGLEKRKANPEAATQPFTVNTSCR